MPSNPEVWLAIPSANPDLCRWTLPLWRSMGYRVAVLQNRRRAEIPADVVVWREEYPGWAASVNLLAREPALRRAAVIVAAGDDVLPDAHTPAHAIARQFLERFPDGFGVMQPTGDAYMHAEHTCPSPWIGRGWIDRMYGGRGALFPGYRHAWAGMELFWLARGLGALWQRPDLVQHHEHWRRTGRPAPEYIADVRAHAREELQLFLARMWLGFPGHEPLPSGRGVRTPQWNAGVLADDPVRLAERRWLAMARHELGPSEPSARMGEALRTLAKRGLTRVAIFGAGAHSRDLADAMREPPVEVVAVIDENPDQRGGRLWNVPVISLEDALALRLDAVVLSSFTMEGRLWRSAGALRDRGVEVVCLYGGDRDADRARPHAERGAGPVVEPSSAPGGAGA